MSTGQFVDRKQVATKTESLLHDYCTKKATLAKNIGPGYVSLWKEIDAYVAKGGKRIRPYLVVLAYAAYGGTDLDTILPVACAYELLHNCLLVHDDIIDRDTVRHGSLNIAGSYQKKYADLTARGSDHYALSSALLAGDLLLSASFEIIHTSKLTPEEKSVLTSQLCTAIYNVGGGELVDMESVLYAIDSVDPYIISHYKTAAYSFMAPLLSGASIAQAPEADLENLEKIGLELGLAFQLRDDVLGVFGNEDDTGKSNRSDIFEKKRTALIKHLLQEVEPKTKLRVEKLYSANHELTTDETEEIYKILNSSAAKEKVEREISAHLQRTEEYIEQLNIHDSYKNQLLELAHKAAQRKV